ncbi:MAG: UDP-glucose 4-epimerase GalE [Planctomycetota bacterium]|nr:UDP-glucose 4-epimerase GalE [Planctomycetota bacterium]
MAILVTGAAGYIGSHACKQLLLAGHHVVAIDNLHRGHRAAIDALHATFGDRLRFIEADVARTPTILEELVRLDVDAVMHFAALAYVGESVDQPMAYYRANVAAFANLLDACATLGVQRFVFSSSCATYGQPPDHLIPIPETCPQSPLSPYGFTKLVGERMLTEFAAARTRAGARFAFAALRYFNVAGCDMDGVLGEDHTPETHLVPVVIQAALGLRSHVEVFGDDYPTPDGTCIRDYTHVDDLARAHVAALRALETPAAPAPSARATPSALPARELFLNLGIGKGHSVREIIDAVARVSRREVPVKFGPRRAGDPARLFADPRRAQDVLGWRAQITSIDEIVGSAYRWFERHPQGYPKRS